MQNTASQYHGERGGTQEHDEETDVGTLLLLLKVCMVIVSISGMFVSFLCLEDAESTA